MKLSIQLVVLVAHVYALPGNPLLCCIQEVEEGVIAIESQSIRAPFAHSGASMAPERNTPMARSAAGLFDPSRNTDSITQRSAERIERQTSTNTRLNGISASGRGGRNPGTDELLAINNRWADQMDEGIFMKEKEIMNARNDWWEGEKVQLNAPQGNQVSFGPDQVKIIPAREPRPRRAVPDRKVVDTVLA